MTMTPFDDEPDDATPLTPDEKRGLKPSYIALRSELNDAEAANVLQGRLWAFVRQRNVFEEDVLLRLHKEMFGDVWEWAGDYRSTERNIGVTPHMVRPDMRILIDDVRCQVEHANLPPDDIAISFHHRLVQVHPFPNGNGRWSRLAADMLAVRLDRPIFSWGGGAPRTEAGPQRHVYIAALKAADGGNLKPLIEFARS